MLCIFENVIEKAVGGSFQNPLHVDCFGEGLRNAIEKLDSKNFYAVNPAFD